jgi:hypothetical protein
MQGATVHFREVNVIRLSACSGYRFEEENI